MANNYYGWNYSGVMDHFGGYYPPPPPAYSMTQAAVAYPNVHYTTPQYGPYGAIITSPVVQNVPIRGRTLEADPYQAQTTGHPSCIQDGAHQQAGKNGTQRAGEAAGVAINTGNGNSSAADQSSTLKNGPATAYQAGYDAAVYNAARNYLEEKQTGQKKFWSGLNKDRFRSGRGPVIDPQQWKYCELCKCTCAGEQAFKAHLEGKAHKKKETLGASAAMAMAGSKGHMYCQLCEVSCSSSDAYAAHIKGAKHQKIMKVQMKMGKYIPDVNADASILNKCSKLTKTAGHNATSASIPKINFVGASQPNPIGPQPGGSDNKNSLLGFSDTTDATSSETFDEDKSGDDPSIGPIGLEYIIDSVNETHTAPMFYCKLCDCSFSDPLAKLMHSKGRRHRLQYKKKVDPTLKVDPQSNSYNDRVKNQWRNKRKDSSDNYKQQAETLRYEKELLEWQLMKTQNPDLALYPGTNGSMMYAHGSNNNFSSARDNQHIMSKHNEIYPTEDELYAVQEFVSTCERSLKMVSDKLASRDNTRILKGVMRVGLLAKGLLIRDLLRLELVILTSERPSKKLLQTVVEEMPEQIKTFSERKFKVELSPDSSHLKVEVGDEVKKIEGDEESNQDGKSDESKSFTSCNITCLIFVAPSSAYEKQKATMFNKTRRDDGNPITTDQQLPDCAVSSECYKDVTMEEEKTEGATCEDDHIDEAVTEWALSELKRTKWFQSNSLSSPACTIVVRVLMDFCKRIPTWTPLGQWALELLVERCMDNDPQVSPAIGLRRAFEVVSSGIFLGDGWGLADVCETSNPAVDAVSHMCLQEREDITNSAQHALRLMALGRIHKVLGIPKLPPPPLMYNVPIKRPRTEDW